MSDEGIRECYCSAGSEGEPCECKYQVVYDRPENWVPFRRQKPMVVFDCADESVIFVTSLGQFGTCNPEDYG